MGLKPLSEITKDKTIHIELVNEYFFVKEHLNYLPIKKHNNVVAIPRSKPETTLFDFAPNEYDFLFKPGVANPISFNVDYDLEPNQSIDKVVTKKNDMFWVKLKSDVVADNNMFQAHFDDLTSTVECVRGTIVFSETDTHYRLTTFKYDKKRYCGNKFITIERNITSLILNKVTGDIYTRDSVYKNKKWVRNDIRKNQLSDIINKTSNFISISNVGNGISVLGTDNSEMINEYSNVTGGPTLTYQHINKIVNVLGIDLTPYYYLPKGFPGQINDKITVPNNKQTLSMALVLWYLKTKKIKYPNNPFIFYSESYVGIKLLRKYDMNLLTTILTRVGIKSKYTTKLFNQYPLISVELFAILYHLLGHDYCSQLNPTTFSKMGLNMEFNTAIIGTLSRLNIIIHDKKEMYNNANLWSEISNVLSKKTKYELFCLIRSSELENWGLKHELSWMNIVDHIRMQNELFKYGEIVNIKAKNIKEFHAEHVNWSDKLSFYRKNSLIKYTYCDFFLDTIEIPQQITNVDGQITTFFPIVLKHEKEYYDESTVQNHCVKTYIKQYKSIIISIRKNDKFSLDRVTCEYVYNENKTAFELIQQTSKHNQKPNEEFIPVLENINNRLVAFAKKKQYTQPTVVEVNKINNYEKILSVNNELKYEMIDF